MRCMHGIQGVQTLALFLFVFKFRLRMPSASSPDLSRVVSPVSDMTGSGSTAALARSLTLKFEF